MFKVFIFKSLVTMPKSSRVYIAIWLSFTTIVVAQQDQQEDYHSRSVELDSQSYDNSKSATSKLRHSQDYSYSRSAQNDTQSYSSQSRSPLSRQFKDSQDNYYTGSSYSRSTEHNLPSHRESGNGRSDSQGYYG